MKLSAWVSISDLLPEKKNGFGEFIFDKFIKQKLFTKINQKEVLLALKKSGVNGIELLSTSNVTDEDIQKVQEMLKELGLAIFSIHQSISTLFNIGIQEIEGLFQIANKLKAGVIVLHINVIGNHIYEEHYVQSLKDLERKYKIKIAIENSPISPLTLFNKNTWNGNKFSTLVKEKGFNITFDTTHLSQTGKDIVDFYKKNKDRIVNIHLSDYKKNILNKYLLLANGTHLPLGKGSSPIKQFLNVLKQSNYSGVITMEISGNLQDLCDSARFIKSTF
ncbi:MAG: hypothetical protein A3B41_03005 [Candidatus Levybacteria bacterium RIFCSPLOWO2_01_FULL_37_26]|nr:MAG: hypothetical protein A3B41_03005 [Candidatus Levybacteria bacterium RIFCSPLOWO2_01_FULL_37_26]